MLQWLTASQTADFVVVSADVCLIQGRIIDDAILIDIDLGTSYSIVSVTSDLGLILPLDVN